MMRPLFALLPLLATRAHAYFILSQPILETTRLDPIVNPGGVSTHVHTIAGGSNFDKSMTYASMQAGTCTTAPVTIDKSNYWIPQLYYYNPTDASYTMIPVNFMNAYYLPRAGQDGKVAAFPDGLRMTSGDGNRREFISGDPNSAAISYVCLDFNNDHQGDSAWAQRNSFFSHNCPSGMRAQVNFPPCWDGVNIDSNNHQSHMAWPSGGVDGGDCPASHPQHLVSLFYEFIFEVQNFPFNDAQYPTWVWSNGDATGYGLHGDFASGWPSSVNGSSVLQQAIDQCNADNGVGGNIAACPPLAKYLNTNAANACQPQNPLVYEDIGNGHSIKQLPGNNPLWLGNITKPINPSYVEGNTAYATYASVIPFGYTQVGCIAEGTTGRALTGASFSNDNMTRGACVSYCQAFGYPLAGVEYGRECYCGNSMQYGATNTTLLDASQCAAACANDTYEHCGGASTLTLFNNPSLYSSTPLPAGWAATGCRTEATSGRALSKYSFTSNVMTNELCMTSCSSKGYTLAGVEYSSECYCGNSYGSGSSIVTDGTCSMVCSGNNKQSCGGPNRFTTFSYTSGLTTSTPTTLAGSTSSPTPTPTTAAQKLPAGWTALGCMTDAASTRALVGYSFSSTAMTQELCMSTCVSKGSLLAGVEYAGECYCSTALTSGTTIAATSDCAMKCNGNTTEICGGPNRLTSFNYTIGYVVPTLPTGWTSTGCMTDASSKRALSGYSFASSSMTKELCMSTCFSKGYILAGTEYASECYCGNTYASDSVLANSGCDMNCAGNSTQMCGGSNRLTAYQYSLGLASSISTSATAATSPKPSVAAGSLVTTTTSVKNATPTVTTASPLATTAAVTVVALSNTATSATTVSSAKPRGYLGCFTDRTVPARQLNGTIVFQDNTNMTNELCISHCAGFGYSFAGTESSNLCYCGNYLNQSDTLAASGSCTSTCVGNKAEFCGGTMQISVYGTSNGTGIFYGTKPMVKREVSRRWQVGRRLSRV